MNTRLKMSKIKTKPISLRVDEDLYQNLTQQAEAEHKTVAALIREILKAHNKIGSVDEVLIHKELDANVRYTSQSIKRNLKEYGSELNTLCSLADLASSRMQEISKNINNINIPKLSKIKLMNICSVSFLMLLIASSIVLFFIGSNTISDFNKSKLMASEYDLKIKIQQEEIKKLSNDVNLGFEQLNTSKKLQSLIKNNQIFMWSDIPDKEFFIFNKSSFNVSEDKKNFIVKAY